MHWCRFILTVTFLLMRFSMNCQALLDGQWILGQFIHVDFRLNEVKSDIINHVNGEDAYKTNNTICDSSGQILFFTSGCSIRDRNNNVMENGDSLNPSEIEFHYCGLGVSLFDQNSIILPYPGNIDLYIVLSLDAFTPFQPEDSVLSPIVPLHLYYHVIDIHDNNALGKVISKNNVAVSDTLAVGYIQACKHANGRDWWIMVPEWNSNCYYLLLLTPTGLSEPKKICAGPVHDDLDWGAQVNFSADGKWYARSFSWRMDSDSGHVDLFTFDRCGGDLSHYIHLTFPEDTFYSTGVCFSPGNQFLYVSSYNNVWQYDLSVTDIQNSRQLVGHVEGMIGESDRNSLFFLQRAINGRIYIGSTGSHAFLSTIHFPDKKGIDCDFQAYDFKFPKNHENDRGLPNLPNYRLGPADGSSCDTLGINNVPVAYFRYESDSSEIFNYNFINLSYAEPETFHWTFGDGAENDEMNSAHAYEKSGDYVVCLTVSNSYGTDTFCQIIHIAITGTNVIDHNENSLVYLFPIPTNGDLNIRFSDAWGNSKEIQIRIMDQLGHVWKEEKFESGLNTVSVSMEEVPDGIYFINIVSGRQWYTGKVMRL